MRKMLLLTAVLMCFGAMSHAQKLTIKTNLLHDATLSPNLGVEFALGKKTTFDISGGFNQWDLSNNKRWRHWVVFPELRFWLCENFNGTFFGVHGLGGQFNVGGLDIPIWKLKNLKDRRYEGYAYGGGLTIGYQWILGKRWNLEASISGGYARMNYSVYECVECGKKISGPQERNYFGPTKATLSLIFFIL